MEDAIVSILASAVAIIVSVVVHEFCHGLAAYSQGDMTAKNQGRLTLNPIPHIDPLGTIIIPGMLLLLQSGFLIGWAKPVPFNPYNLRNQRYGPVWVALAGPLSNFVLFLVAGMALKDLITVLPGTNALLFFLSTFAVTNFVLAVFNILPIPPLDGSKVLFGLLPPRFEPFREIVEKNAFFIFLAFIALENIYPFTGRFISSAFAFVTNTFGIPL